jgi:endonuclease-3
MVSQGRCPPASAIRQTDKSLHRVSIQHESLSMATPNRSALLTRLHKVLKKHYKPVEPAMRPVLEHLLFACCLENAGYEAAEQAFQILKTGFFDWNEVRVSTARELAETVPMLPEPLAAMTNVKRLLYSIFESTYSFDMENLKKLNLGQAVQKIEKFEGSTPFIVAYATQMTLGGHAIPVDRGTRDALVVVGVIAENEAKDGHVSGMERAIPKSKGIEFASLLHQLGAEMVTNPYSPAFHKLLLEIAPEAKDRLPKRQPKPKTPPPAPEPKVKETKEPAAKAKPVVADKKKPSAEKAAADKPAPEKPAAEKPAKAAEKPPAKKPADKPAERKQAAAKRTVEPKKPVKKPAPKKPAAALSKRKPR